jgi:hypothetical protein
MPAKVGDYVLIISERAGRQPPQGAIATLFNGNVADISVDQVDSKNGKKLKLKKDKTNEIDEDTWKDKNGKKVKVVDTATKNKLEKGLRKMSNITIIRAGPIMLKQILDIINP